MCNILDELLVRLDRGAAGGQPNDKVFARARLEVVDLVLNVLGGIGRDNIRIGLDDDPHGGGKSKIKTEGGNRSQRRGGGVDRVR